MKSARRYSSQKRKPKPYRESEKRMANRNTLHSNKLDAFRKWLIKTGWTIEEPKGIWEVLRAKKAGRQNPLIVYQKMNKEHLSVLDRDIDVIKRFCKKSRWKMVKCNNCKNLETKDNGFDAYSWCEKINDCPHEDIERDCEHYVPMINADRIRSMTDEELAIALLCVLRNLKRKVRNEDEDSNNRTC